MPKLRLQNRATRWLCCGWQTTPKPLVYPRVPTKCVPHASAVNSRYMASTAAQLSRRSATDMASNAQRARLSKAPRAGPYKKAGQHLAERRSSILLYKAPAHNGFELGSYLFSGFCFTYAGSTFYTYCLRPPDGLPAWVQYSYLGITLFVIMVGFWSLNKPHSIISKINALPSSSARVGGSLHLELQTSSLVPLFRKPRSIVVAAEDITISSSLYRPQGTVADDNVSLFTSIGNWLSMENLIDVRMRDRFWPLYLDPNAAWADEGGRTIDSVVKHRR